ncbi:MAG: T9SS type A sorting domain-containing protein [Bacteroidota bacterium]
MIVLLLSVSITKAQLEIYPISRFKEPSPTSTSNNYRSGPLSLPFFDDFANVQQGVPSADLWENGGVYVNNTLADNPPSVNVATFDAYDAEGKAYDLSSPLVTGFSDTLTSHPIDLSGITPGADDVYLTFFWQLQGLGETPDPEDYLVLEFKDPASEEGDNWNELWRQDGEAAATDFQRANIRVAEEYFNADFQFRFVRFGRNSGFFDVFHIDYVYLDQGIENIPQDVFFPDVAYVRAPSSFLSKYTAMPINQYFLEPSTFTAPNITTTLRNLNNSSRVIDNLRFILRDTVSNTELSNIAPTPPPASTFPLLDAGATFEFTAPTVSLTPLADSMVIEAKFDVGLATEAQRDNDTIRSYTVLNDYYAYDDGTAEYVAGIRQRFGRIAVQYVVNQPARISALDICFVPFETDLSSQTFVLSVWRRVEGREEEPLFQSSVQVEYPSEPNGFVRFPIESDLPITVADTFYVGIQQTTDDLLAIGFDQNTNAQPYTFQNTQGIWEQDDRIIGSLMIRPVFDESIVSSIGDDSFEDKINIYPNPTQGKVYIETTQRLSIQLYNLQGLALSDYSWEPSSKSLDISRLPAGLYLLHIENQKGEQAVKKIIKQ